MSGDLLAWQRSDHYALLGITRMADEDDIRRAFRQKAKEHHPDRFPLHSTERENADQLFKQLTIARDTLLDAQQREAYDREQELIQQAYFDAVIYQVPVTQKSRPSSTAFIQTLKSVFQHAAQKNDYESPDEEGVFKAAEEEDAPKHRGIPQHSKSNAAHFYYSRGMRLAARGLFRRALYDLNNARMLDPELPISESFLHQLKHRAYYR